MHGLMVIPDGSIMFAELWYGVDGDDNFMSYGIINVTASHSYRKHLCCDPQK